MKGRIPSASPFGRRSLSEESIVLNEKVIALGLAAEPGNRLTAFRRLLERSLGLLREALAAGGESEYQECCDDLEACEGAVATGIGVEELEVRIEPCFQAGTEAVAGIKIRQQEHRRELTGLVGLVRQAVEAVSSENRSLHARVGLSTERFEAAARMDDIQTIKIALEAEVRTLQQAMAERRTSWDARLNELADRVSVLEHQLLTSRHEASLDPLTHIANRRTFDRACREWVMSAGSGFVLAVLDVDGFKAINDAFGHLVGDQALIAVAQAIKASVRSQDLVARLGGDEFALLGSDLTLRQAESRLRGIVASLASTQFPSSMDPAFVVTVSCGIAEFSAGDTAASLLQRADGALYEAKRSGKNRVVTRARPFLTDLMKRR